MSEHTKAAKTRAREGECRGKSQHVRVPIPFPNGTPEQCLDMVSDEDQLIGSCASELKHT